MSSPARTSRMRRGRGVWPLLAVIAGLLAASATPAAAAAAVQPCAPGTPSALKFTGLPHTQAFGVDRLFSTDFGNLDWDVVGRVRYRMADSRTGDAFFDRTGPDLADLGLRLDLGNPPALVSAQFTQSTEQQVYDPATDDYTYVTVQCEQTISRTVSGYRHFRLASCDRLRYRPRSVVIACGDGNFGLRRIHWRHWNRSIAKGTGQAYLNDCSPYCAAGRFHFVRAHLTAYRLRVCRRGDSAEGYHYTRLRIHYTRILSRRYFPYINSRARRGYTANTRCFSY